MPDDYSADMQTNASVKVGGPATGGIGTAGGRHRFGVTLEAARIPCIAARSAYDGRCVGGSASTRPIVRRFLLAAVSAAFAAAVVFSGAALADPRGAWLTPGGKSHVEIAPCGDRLCGRIVWLAEPNNEQGRTEPVQLVLSLSTISRVTLSSAANSQAAGRHGQADEDD